LARAFAGLIVAARHLARHFGLLKMRPELLATVQRKEMVLQATLADRISTFVG